MTNPPDDSDQEDGSPSEVPGDRPSEDEYFARIEEHFARRRGGPLLLSPTDWQLVERWHSEGVPLSVVLRGINRAFDRFRHSGRRSDRINSLRYCRQHVEESWEEYRESRASPRRDHDPALEAADHLVAAADACRKASTDMSDEDVRTVLVDVADELDDLARRARDGEVGPRQIDARARALEETLAARLAAADDDGAAEAPASGDRQGLDLPPFSPYGV